MLERTDDESRKDALATLAPRRCSLRPLAVRICVVAATAPFGADVLERLAARHDVAALLTRPDSPAGRGRKLAPPPAKLVAERLGIPVLQPERPTAELELPGDAIVVAAYGLLIPESLLERGLWLNVHPSLLPRWRGAAPVERALLAGDDGDGRDDPRDGEGARRRPDRGAARLPADAGGRRGDGLRARGRARGRAARRGAAGADRSRRRRARRRTRPRSRPPTASSTSRGRRRA